MASVLRYARTATAVLALASALAITLTMTTTAGATPMPPVAFPQEHSDVTADPDVVFGRLPNGMGYVLQHRAMPPHTATILMRVGAGSMMETNAQRGLAHFLEHMAFEGSTHLKNGELKATLERKGFLFGADANAVTSASQTVYILDAPNVEPDTLSTAFSSLREIAGNLTIDADAVDHERGVVLSEERARASATLAEALKYDALVYPDQKYGQGFFSAIGSRDIIQSATRDDLVSFYKTWYRPQLTTLVVVGDIDPKAIEAEIKARFGDWQAAGPMPEEPDWGKRTPHGVQLFEYTNGAIARRLRLEWIRAPETRPDSLARHVDNLAEAAVLVVLERRLTAAIHAPDSAILKATVTRSTAFKTSRTVDFDIEPKPGKTQAAFDQAYGVLKTLRAGGVTPAEIAFIAALTAESRSREDKRFDSLSNRAAADNIVAHFGTDTVERGKAGILADIDASAPRLDKAGLDAALAQMFSGDGPVLSNYGASTDDFDPQAFKTEYLAQTAAPAAPYVEVAAVPWPYTDFGPAQAPVSHTADPDFGYDHFVFANGVVLNVKSTTFTPGEVQVGVGFLGGIQRFDPSKPRPLPMAIGGLFISGGLGKLDSQAINTALAGKAVTESLSISDSVATLRGTTNADDLGTQLQVLMAYATDPGLRDRDFDRFKTVLAQTTQNQMHASPTETLSFEFNSLIRPGDWRYDAHIAENPDAVTWPDLTSLYREVLSDTPIVITMVGDVDAQTAAKAVAGTFATLPPRPAAAQKFAGADQTSFPPPPGDHVFYHNGRHDLSVSAVVWPTTGLYADVPASYRLDMLSQIIKNRLFDTLREKLGAVYSPTVNALADADYPKLGYIRVGAQVKAGDDTVFRDALAAIAADLRAHPVSADELLRVKTPALQAAANAENTNLYWFSTLSWLGRQPQSRAVILKRKAIIETTTADELMDLAKTWLRDDKAVFVRVVPRTAEAKPPAN